jgi:hypothetical protein
VALQVDRVEPAEIAEPGEVEAHDVADEGGVVAEALDGVVG